MPTLEYFTIYKIHRKVKRNKHIDNVNNVCVFLMIVILGKQSLLEDVKFP